MGGKTHLQSCATQENGPHFFPGEKTTKISRCRKEQRKDLPVNLVHLPIFTLFLSTAGKFRPTDVC